MMFSVCVCVCVFVCVCVCYCWLESVCELRIVKCDERLTAG